MSDEQKEEFCLCKGYDNNWVAGPFNSIEEARNEAKSWNEPGLRIHKVKFSDSVEWLPSLDTIVEWMDEYAYDNGLVLDGEEMHVIPKDKCSEAREALEAWARKYIVCEIDRWSGDLVEEVSCRKPYEKPAVIAERQLAPGETLASIPE